MITESMLRAALQFRELPWGPISLSIDQWESSIRELSAEGIVLGDRWRDEIEKGNVVSCTHVRHVLYSGKYSILKQKENLFYE